MPDSEPFTIRGKVVRVELEGGFWGVVDSEGNRYVPISPFLPEIQKDGLNILAHIELVTVFSTTMWGKHARFHSIQGV